jgi:hypothetical protein
LVSALVSERAKLEEKRLKKEKEEVICFAKPRRFLDYNEQL